MKILLKVGSNILTTAGSGACVTGSGASATSIGLNKRRIASLAKDISAVLQHKHEVLLVSSGAVAAGMQKMGIEKYPRDIRIKQAMAAVGQSSLMWAYEKYFGNHGVKVAQVLLTRDDFKDRTRYINAKNTLTTLLDLGFIPVVNENDPISVDEIKFGDNDHLAALVAGMLGVDMMIILSDVDGLFDKDPGRYSKARMIDTVEEITDELLGLADSSGSHVGTGGMYSKLIAARMSTAHGIPVHIINGKKSGLVPELVNGKKRGTFFLPSSKGRLSSRKGWIAYGIRCKGAIHLDEGAVQALLKRGKSLLPSGILKTRGSFNEGDAVECLAPDGRRVAKGLANYSAEDIKKIQGKKTSQIESILGYKYSDEVIHRDNLVVTVEK